MLGPGQRDKRNRFLRLSSFSFNAESGESISAHLQAMAIHIGSAIKKELEKQQKTVVWLAEQISCHRSNIYRIFEKDSIDTRTLMKISDILNHDFFADHSMELKKNDCR